MISSALNAAWRGVERISALNAKSKLVKLASSEEREKVEKYLDTIPVSGKTPKTPEKSKK